MAKIKPFTLIPDERDVKSAQEIIEAASDAIDGVESAFRLLAIRFEAARLAVEQFKELSINIDIDDEEEKEQ